MFFIICLHDVYVVAVLRLLVLWVLIFWVSNVVCSMVMDLGILNVMFMNAMLWCSSLDVFNCSCLWCSKSVFGLVFNECW